MRHFAILYNLYHQLRAKLHKIARYQMKIYTVTRSANRVFMRSAVKMSVIALLHTIFEHHVKYVVIALVAVNRGVMQKHNWLKLFF